MNRHIVFPWLIWLLAIVAMIVGTSLLSGCAQEFSGVCGVVPIGQDEHGIAYARVYCRPQ